MTQEQQNPMQTNTELDLDAIEAQFGKYGEIGSAEVRWLITALREARATIAAQNDMLAKQFEDKLALHAEIVRLKRQIDPRRMNFSTKEETNEQLLAEITRLNAELTHFREAKRMEDQFGYDSMNG